MKTAKIVYWVSTIILGAMMLFACYSYLTQDAVKQSFQHLGYPDYFRVELAIAKGLGAIVLLVPLFGWRMKEWAYAGFFITFVSAFIAHVASGDPLSYKINPLVGLVILFVSYVSLHIWKGEASIS